VPTSELRLDGAPAILVVAPGEGVRAITPMLGVTRTWNAVSAVSAMRRGLAPAGDYAPRRRGRALAGDDARRPAACGGLRATQPLHADTLASLEAEYAPGFCLAFRS